MDTKSLRIQLGGGMFQVHAGEELWIRRNCWTPDRHCHADYEVHIILDGACTVDIGTERCRLCAGDAMLVMPGQYHRPIVTETPLLRFTIQFQTSDHRFGRTIGDGTSAFHRFHADAALCATCREIFAEGDEASIFRAEMLETLFRRAFIQILRALRWNEAASTASAMGNRRNDVIDTYFEEHPSYGTEEELAAQLHLSKRQLNRVLRDYYGMNYRQMLLHIRMDRAGYLLRTTELRVGEICREVGYSSETAFFKAFSDAFGMTPLRYRAASIAAIEAAENGASEKTSKTKTDRIQNQTTEE